MTTASLLLGIVLTVPVANPSSPASEASNTQRDRGPVILSFTSDDCGYCREMAPTLAALRRKGYPIYDVDVADRPDLVREYEVEGTPFFVVLDSQNRVVERHRGTASAQRLVRLYRNARALEHERSSDVHTTGNTTVRTVSASPKAANPKPWATVVRIKVHDHRSIGFGSGTVIYSDPDEAIILTCAHIFKVSGRQPPPGRFDRPVHVERFDGVLTGPRKQQVSPIGQGLRGEVIDYDFRRDVALIRIRPGKVIPAARVVPKHWDPKARMSMITVGCSHGKDATAWNTVITDPLVQGAGGHSEHLAIQCKYSPKQGRSGGGLFTDDGYVAGVCNFAYLPTIGLGLYAAPASIYRILDRNGLSDLYEPVRSSNPRNQGLAIADRGRSKDREGRGAAPDASPIVRLQNEKGGGARRNPDRAGSDLATLEMDPITVPPPDLLGINVPEAAVADASPSSSRSTRSTRNDGGGHWRALDPDAPTRSTAEKPARNAETEVAQLKAGPGVGGERISPVRPAQGTQAKPEPKPAPSGAEKESGRHRWAPIKKSKW